MTGRLKVNKRGWEALKKRLRRFDTRAVDVGFFKGSKYGADNDNLPVATVAFKNDQGSPTNPPRPFLTVDFVRFADKEFHKKAKHVFLKLLFNKHANYIQELNKLGEYFKDSLTRIIYDYPGHNSKTWVDVKGFDDPLYHTGVMVNAVEYKIKTPSQVEKRVK